MPTAARSVSTFRQALEPMVWSGTFVLIVALLVRPLGLPADFLAVIAASIAPAALLGLVVSLRRLRRLGPRA